jgi:hypothetical protein
MPFIHHYLLKTSKTYDVQRAVGNLTKISLKEEDKSRKSTYCTLLGRTGILYMGKET